MAENFGIVTFSDQGPVKTWSRLAAIASHNNREKPEPHCDPRAPGPVRLWGGADLITEVKTRLRDHQIDPAGLRKNAAIAFEAIMTASPKFFTYGAGVEAQKRTGAWIAAACSFARDFWGGNRIVSMVLHVDETTPHIHVVLLPLVEKTYRRWPDRGKTWTLEAKSISGPGMYQAVHDAYAKAMSPLGLVRGVSGSRAKYRPYAVELAELDAEKARAVAAADAAATAQALASEQAAKDAERNKVFLKEQARLLEEVNATRRALLDAQAEVGRERAKIRNKALRLEALKRQIEADAAAVQENRRAAAKDRHEARMRLFDVKQSIAELAKASDFAEALGAALLSVPHSELPSGARFLLRKLQDLNLASVLVRVSAADREALPLQTRRQLDRITGQRR